MVKSAKTYDEIKPLIDLCKAGKLFDIQTWISNENPVNLPLASQTKTRKKSPLEIAMELGFHSLIQVLLENGAAVQEPRYNPLLHALWKRRLDMVELLVMHGADIYSVSIEDVFDTWAKEIIKFFIEKGVDLDSNQPLAYALCARIYPALAIFKQYKDLFSTFQEQVNYALRYHCREGNAKWVSLMLWAGGDPYAQGPDSPGEADSEECISAIELAVLWDHPELFKLKGMRLDPSHPSAPELLRHACFNKEADLLKKMLDNGFDPDKMEDKGSSLVQSLISTMNWRINELTRLDLHKTDVDNDGCREKLKMIHMVVRHGARWEPDRYGLMDARRTMLKMKPDYTMELVWIFTEYGAWNRETAERLLAGPKMRAFMSKHVTRLDELKKSFGEDIGNQTIAY